MMFLKGLWALPWARRLLLAGVAILAVWGAWQYVGGLHKTIDAQETAYKGAQQTIKDLRGQVAGMQENARANAGADLLERKREQETATQVQNEIRKVYVDRDPTPQEYRIVLDPIADAFDGLRRLEAGRGQESAERAGVQE